MAWRWGFTRKLYGILERKESAKSEVNGIRIGHLQFWKLGSGAVIESEML